MSPIKKSISGRASTSRKINTMKDKKKKYSSKVAETSESESEDTSESESESEDTSESEEDKTHEEKMAILRAKLKKEKAKLVAIKKKNKVADSSESEDTSESESEDTSESEEDRPHEEKKATLHAKVEKEKPKLVAMKKQFKVVESLQLKNEKSHKEAKAHKLMNKNKESKVEAREGKKKPKTRQMGEALILSIIEKLENRPVIFAEDKKEGVIHNLRMMLNFLKDKKLGEGTRLDYMIADIDEMVNDATNLNERPHEFPYNHDMHTIKSWVKRVYAYMLKYGVDGAETRSEKVGEGEVDADLVGMEEDVKQLLSKAIFNGKKNLCIPFISGMIGIGKTALARHLYKHKSVIHRFPRRAWVYVPTDISHKELLIKLIKQLVDSEELKADSLLEKMDNKNLQHLLCRNLQGRPYFIVLDDINKELQLESILKAIPHEDKGSRLLFTSRSQNINTHWISSHNHVVKALDANKSWKLFIKTIENSNNLTSEHNFPKELEKKGKEMLTACGGVPLAIKEVARELAEKKRSGSEWEQLLESVDLGASETMKLLESSYDALKPELKSIFLHLAFFKENNVIRSEKFVLMSPASAMISRGDIRNGYRNLRWLTRESLIEVKDYPMKSFLVNSLYRRLSIKRAKEEIGFEILGNPGNSRPSLSPRHRVMCCSREKFSHSTVQDDKHIVSLVFQGGGRLDANWKSFELVRMLDLEDFGLKVLSEDIGALIELRYLGLRNNHLLKLPGSLGCLINLEVLDAALNFMAEMPDVIWKLCRLRHLFISDVIWQKPLKIDMLENLEVLTYISVDDLAYDVSGLRKMIKLKKLGVVEVDRNSDVGKLFDSLAEIKRLDHLILRGFRFRSMPSLDKLGILSHITKLVLDGLLTRLPIATNFPPKLTYLKLLNSRLEEDPMPVLEKLDNLRFLKLRNAYTGTQMVAAPEGFGSLLGLYIEELWNITSLKFGKGSMEYLKKLEVKNCPYLDILPKEIGLMDYLEEVKMVTTKKVATKIKNSKLILKRHKPKSEYSSAPFYLVMNGQS